MNLKNVDIALKHSVCSAMVVIVMLFSYGEETIAQTAAGPTFRSMRSQYFIDYSPITVLDDEHINVVIIEYSLMGNRYAIVLNYEDSYGYFSNFSPVFHQIDTQDSIYTDYLKLYEWVNNNRNSFEENSSRRGMSPIFTKKIRFSAKCDGGSSSYLLIDGNNYEEMLDSELSRSLESVISEIEQKQISLIDILYRDETNN